MDQNVCFVSAPDQTDARAGLRLSTPKQPFGHAISGLHPVVDLSGVGTQRPLIAGGRQTDICGITATLGHKKKHPKLELDRLCWRRALKIDHGM